MSAPTAFSPAYGEGVEIATSTSSSSTSITAGKGDLLKVTNHSGTAAEIVYVMVGVGTQTAVDTEECAVGAGETVYLSLQSTDNAIGAISATGTPTITAIPGHALGR